MDNNPPNRIYFNTDALPERDRFPAFCEGMFRHVIGADILELGQAPFSGTLEIRRAGAVGIADISVTAAKMARHASHTSDGNDAIVVQLWQRGRAAMAQGDHDNSIASRDGLIIDNAKPAIICTDSPSRFWSLTIPRASIVAARPDVTAIAGTKLIGNIGFLLLYGYLEQITSADLVSCQTARLVGNHLIDLAAFALGGKADGLAKEPGARASRRVASLFCVKSNAAAAIRR